VSFKDGIEIKTKWVVTGDLGTTGLTVSCNQCTKLACYISGAHFVSGMVSLLNINFVSDLWLVRTWMNYPTKR